MKAMLVLFSLLAAPLLFAQHATVRVEPSNLHGPRPLQEVTATAAVRDYLESWQALKVALAQNRTGLLDDCFVGDARDKLTDTVREQTALGIHTRYKDRAHDIQIVFYAPDGLSIQLLDTVDYEQQVFDKDKVLATQRTHARYIVVLTPAQTRWRVRVFQASAE